MDKIKALVSHIPQKQFKNKKVFLAAVILLLILSVAVVIVKNKKDKVTSFKSVATKEVAKALVDTVGELINLPTNEEPIIATVSDKNQLGDQKFFRKAENGDKVLIYNISKKVILYRPSRGKIISVAPLAGSKSTKIQQNATSSASESISPATEVVKVYKLVLYNATNISGLTRTVENQLKSKIPNIEVVGRGNAEGDYKRTLVVDLSADKIGLGGSNEAFAKTLAKQLSGEVGKLPKGQEKHEEGDFLIILAGSQ